MIGPERRILLLWALAIVVIARRAIAAGNMPHPHSFAGSAIVYGAASLLSEVTPKLATTLAVGWTLNIVFQDLAGEGSRRGPGPRARTAKPAPQARPGGRRPPGIRPPAVPAIARPRRGGGLASSTR